MKKSVLATVVALGVLGLVAGSATWARSGKDGGDGGFAIYVAPGTIVPNAPCNWVTVHTNVALRAVDGVLAAVSGYDIDVAQVYADSLGNLVVKLRYKDVLARVCPPSATVTLMLVVNGQPLTASETVRVKD